MTRVLFVSGLALMTLFSSLSSAAPASSTPRPAASASRSRLSDPELDRIIRTKLAKSKVGKDGFTFKVKGGVVTWEGSTGVIQHKGAATRMARTAGAVDVVNNIKISDEARARAAGNLSGAGPRRAVVKEN